jgi:hypothetical protein
MKWNISPRVAALFTACAIAGSAGYANAANPGVITNFDSFPVTASPGSSSIEHDGIAIVDHSSQRALQIYESGIPGGNIKGHWLTIGVRTNPVDAELTLPAGTQAPSVSFDHANGVNNIKLVCKYANGTEAPSVYVSPGNGAGHCAAVVGTTVAALTFAIPSGSGGQHISIDNIVSP